MAGRVFQQATEEIQTRVRIVMGRFHDRLMEPVIPIGVTVETLMVYGPRNKDGQQTGPAIKVNGRDALACIRVTSLEERVSGRADAVMWIDGDNWKDLPVSKHNALIDHELTHLELALHPRTGEIQLDDVGRVKLRLRPHDFQVGWFDEVAERHGNESFEVLQAARLIADGYRQMYFPGFDVALNHKKRRA